MKKLTFLLLAQIVGISVMFGHKLPMKWGKITNDELKMTSYSYDPDASAVILCDYGTAEVGPRTEYTRHVRIKILKSSGLAYATVEIPFKSVDHFDVVMGIGGETFNLNDKGQMVKTKLLARDIKEIDIDARNKKKVFTLPDVKPGSVIEYRYTIQSLDLTRLQNWYFQSTIPTILSEYWVSMPRRFNYLITFQKGRALDINEQKEFGDRIQWLYNTDLKKAHRDLSKEKALLYASNRGTAKVYLSYGETMYFKMKDVPALKPTPDMVAFSDFFPTVKTQLYYVDRSFGLPFYYRTILEASQTDYGSWNSSRLYYNNYKGYILYWLPTWEEFNQTCLNDDRIGDKITKSFHFKPVLETLHIDSTDQLKSAEAIYQYVKSNIQWDGTYSIYATRSLDRILDKKTGSSGEINILLVSLLKKAGINANPVLVRTRNLGRVENMYPVNDQFNHIIAQVVIGDKDFYLDASTRHNTFEKLPWTLDNAAGWVLKDKDYGWVDISNPK
jgi:hypothetical protein